MRLLEDRGAKSFFIRALTGDMVKTGRRHGQDQGKTPSELKFLNKKSKLVYAPTSTQRILTRARRSPPNSAGK